MKTAKDTLERLLGLHGVQTHKMGGVTLPCKDCDTALKELQGLVEESVIGKDAPVNEYLDHNLQAMIVYQNSLKAAQRTANKELFQ